MRAGERCVTSLAAFVESATINDTMLSRKGSKHTTRRGLAWGRDKRQALARNQAFEACNAVIAQTAGGLGKLSRMENDTTSLDRCLHFDHTFWLRKSIETGSLSHLFVCGAVWQSYTSLFIVRVMLGFAKMDLVNAGPVISSDQ